MSAPPLKLAVLGLGKAGVRHVEAARACPLVELVAVADTSRAARERIGSDDDGAFRVADSLEGLMASSPEAVVVALPHASLADVAIRLCEAGLHVLVEKPMANTLADARRVLDAAARSGVRLMVNYNHRFRDEYQTAKGWLEVGRVGRARFFVEQMYAAAGPLPQWVWDERIAGGGMMTYNGAHMLDHVMWLAGEPVASVSASTAHLHFDEELEDTTAATLRFSSGALATLVQHKSSVAHAETGWETRVFGTGGAIRVVSGEGAYLSTGEGSEQRRSGDERRFIRALEELASAIREQRAPEPDGASGLSVLACLKALYRSAAAGGGHVPVEN